MELINSTLLDRIRRGDSYAFATVFKRYWEQLFAAAYRRLGDEDLSKDIVQEVFMNIWDKCRKIPVDPAHFEFYLLRAVKSRVLNYYTSQQARRQVLDAVAHRMEMMDGETSDPKQYRELEIFLDQQVDQLPETMKAVLLMRNDDHTVERIAATLNIAEQTVRNYLSEASHRLRKGLLKKISDGGMASLFVSAFLLMNN